MCNLVFTTFTTIIQIQNLPELLNLKIVLYDTISEFKYHIVFDYFGHFKSKCGIK